MARVRCRSKTSPLPTPPLRVRGANQETLQPRPGICPETRTIAQLSQSGQGPRGHMQLTVSLGVHLGRRRILVGSYQESPRTNEGRQSRGVLETGRVLRAKSQSRADGESDAPDQVPLQHFGSVLSSFRLWEHCLGSLGSCLTPKTARKGRKGLHLLLTRPMCQPSILGAGLYLFGCVSLLLQRNSLCRRYRQPRRKLGSWN